MPEIENRKNRGRFRAGWLIPAFISLAVPALLLAEGSEMLIWVKYDQDTQKLSMSDGRSRVPKGAVPGDFYESERGRMKREGQWRSPLDLIYEYDGGKEGRVVFSHERHFGLTGEKSCSKCHDDSVGLGDKDKIRPSKASSKSAESHNSKSIGRFCSTCHDGKTEVADISRTAPREVQGAIFSANKTSDQNSCSRCHTPRSHGRDYTNRHGEVAEEGRGEDCSSCHRGADRFDRSHQNQAKDFKAAQLQLIKDPENETAFKKILPSGFCYYCHNSDQKAWEREGGNDRYRRRDRDDDD